MCFFPGGEGRCLMCAGEMRMRRKELNPAQWCRMRSFEWTWQFLSSAFFLANDESKNINILDVCRLQRRAKETARSAARR